MSFLGRSDCSVNGNGNAQFGKRATGDQPLQEGARQGAAIGNQLEGSIGMRHVNMMDVRDRAQMNRFIGGDLTSEHTMGTFDMRQIGNELQKLNNNNSPPLQLNNPLSRSSVGARLMGDKSGMAWSSEFSGQEQKMKMLSDTILLIWKCRK